MFFEGYSVFVVRQKNPNAPIEIPRTDADELARAVPENASAPRASSTRMPGGDHKSPFGHIEGLEDEDMELQAALQASLGGAYHEFDVPFIRPGPAAQSFASRPIPGGLGEEEDDDDEHLDLEESDSESSTSKDLFELEYDQCLRSPPPHASPTCTSPPPSPNPNPNLNRGRSCSHANGGQQTHGLRRASATLSN